VAGDASYSSNQKVVSVFYGLVTSIAVMAATTHDRSIKAVFFWLVIILIVTAIAVTVRRLGSRRRKRSAPDDWHELGGENDPRRRPQ
jgi:uncharacterized membrane protein YhaH (DUF805 family)